MKGARLGLLLAVSWLVALTLSALIAQQPLARAMLTAIGRTLIDVLAVTAIVGAAGGIGATIGPNLPRLSALERQVMRLLIGLGVMSIAVLVLGLMGLFPSSVLGWIATLAPIGLLHRPIRNWLRDTRQELCLLLTSPLGGFTLWLRRMVVVLLALALILTLAPPTKWDALTYHLAGPRQYLDAGRIVSFPENHFLGFPQLTEMLYLWLMILARPQAAGMLHWVFGVNLLLLVIGLVRRLGHPDAGWLAAVILLTGESLWLEFGWPYNDLAPAAAVIAALVVFLTSTEVGPAHRERYVLWGGVFVGLALSAKYTAAGAAVGVAVLLLYLTWRDGVAVVLWRLAMLTSVSLLVLSPWLIKNALLDGNPVSPFVWGTSGFDALDQWYYMRPGTGLEAGTLLLVPVQATVFGREGLAPYGGSMGPLLVGLLPLIALGWRQRTRHERTMIGALGVFAGTVYVIWLIGAATSWFLVQLRLLLPIFPVLALISALGASGLQATVGRSGVVRIVRAVVLLISLIAVLRGIINVVEDGPVGVAIGLERQENYLARRLGVHYAAMEQINALPESARVLTLWEPRTFYCHQRCIPDSMIDQWWHDRRVYGDPARIAAHWRDQGITHVLIFESGWQFLVNEEPHEPLTQADIDALNSLRRSQMTQLWDGCGAYTLYELRDEAVP